MTTFRAHKFIKDLVIAGDDGNLYYIREDEWKKYKVPLSQFKQGVRQLLQMGVALAAVPEPQDAPQSVSKEAVEKAAAGQLNKGTSTTAATSDPPVLGFCYLVSLASLRTKTVFQTHMEASEDVSVAAGFGGGVPPTGSGQSNT